MRSRPRVFVVNEPLVKKGNEWVRLFDVSSAHRFGELHFIYPPGRLPQDPSYLVRVAEEKLTDLRTTDYLLMIGDTVGISVVSALAARQVNRLNLLVWNNRDRDYYESTVELPA